MFGELLQSGRVESVEKRQQYLQIINTESERLGSIIDNLLDFSRPNAVASPTRSTRRTSARIVHRVVEASRMRAGKVEFRVKIEPDLPLVVVDERPWTSRSPTCSTTL